MYEKIKQNLKMSESYSENLFLRFLIVIMISIYIFVKIWYWNFHKYQYFQPWNIISSRNLNRNCNGWSFESCKLNAALLLVLTSKCCKERFTLIMSTWNSSATWQYFAHIEISEKSLPLIDKNCNKMKSQDPLKQEANHKENPKDK